MQCDIVDTKTSSDNNICTVIKLLVSRGLEEEQRGDSGMLENRTCSESVRREQRTGLERQMEAHSH